MSRKGLVCITLTIVLALVFILADILFVIPFLRYGEIPLLAPLFIYRERDAGVSEDVPAEEPPEVEARNGAEETAAEYEKALSLLFRREFDAAHDLFTALGDYEDCVYWAEFAREYPALDPEFGPAVISEEYLRRTYDSGRLYSLTDCGQHIGGTNMYKGLVYVPAAVDEKTCFIQYYCGGEGGDYLWYDGVYGYFDSFSPNAVIVFTNESGTAHLADRNEFQRMLLRQLAYELGTVVHDASAVGSSMGAYTAMQFVYGLCALDGIKPGYCLTLDTGCDWSLDYLALSKEQCEALAQAGTKFYLFEDLNFENEIRCEAMQNLICSGIDVREYLCRCAEHEAITKNAFSLGLISLCAGEEIDIPECEYCRVELYPGITGPGELSWPPRPESETRLIYAK